MVAAVLGDEGAISVVEVEMASELLGSGLACETSVAARLVVGEEADRHPLGYAAIAGLGVRLPSSSLARTRGCPLAST